MWNYDPFEGIPTKEQYLARRAYGHILRATESIPLDDKKRVQGVVARSLIKKVCEEEGNHKQAIEMWIVFHRKMPDVITNEDYPLESGP